MKILKLNAENVKRLSIVEISPDGNLVEIAGKNDQGKTSVLDAIAFALGGKKLIPSRPIRRGEEKAEIVAHLGDRAGLKYIVKRTLRRSGDDGEAYTTSLYIEDDKGVRPRAPQEFLDSMLGDLTLDPVEFIRASSHGRVAKLQSLVKDFDFVDAAKRRQEAYDKRRDINRDEKSARSAANETKVSNEWAERVDVSQTAAALEGDSLLREEQSVLTTQISSYDDEIAETENRITALEKRRDEIAANRKTKIRREREIDSQRLSITERMSLEASLSTADETNRVIDQREKRDRLVKEADGYIAESTSLSALIDQIDGEIEAAVKSANLPVRGLALSEEGVILDGLPFEQSSTSRQLRCALAIAMAENPTIRIIRIKDGACLDDDAMQTLFEVAEADDFQIWIERVVSSGPAAIIMEDGHVR